MRFKEKAAVAYFMGHPVSPPTLQECAAYFFIMFMPALSLLYSKPSSTCCYRLNVGQNHFIISSPFLSFLIITPHDIYTTRWLKTYPTGQNQFLDNHVIFLYLNFLIYTGEILLQIEYF